jgi:Ca2+-binding RTX toxin-like protein
LATAKVGAGFSLDMATLDVGSLLEGTITVANVHQIQVAFTQYNFVNFFGNFTFPNGEIHGTLQQIRDYSGGHLWFSVSGMAVNAAAFVDNVIAGTSNSALSLLFSGNDLFIGGSFDDRLLAFGGNDTMNGGGGRDRLRGMSGNDTINGGPGDDRLTGGIGNDKFVFQLHFGTDVIADFGAGPTVGDVIAVSHLLLPSVGWAKSHATIEAGHVVVHTTATDSIALLNVHAISGLNANDFLIT